MIEVGSHITHKENSNIKKLVMDIKDMFDCSYDDLKVYNDDVIQNLILLGAKPFRNKLRKINPKLGHYS